MNSRDKVKALLNNSTCEGAFWMGNPLDETVQVFSKSWGIEASKEAMHNYLNDDCRWIMADEFYSPSENSPARLFDPSWGIAQRVNLSEEGCFANIEDISETDGYPWPDPEAFNWEAYKRAVELQSDKMVFTGVWSHFFHIVADFFGMENYFIKMYENPKLVHEVTNKVVDFFVQANDKCFSEINTGADIMFFGNDFGTQRDLIISPDKFREFILPSVKRLIEVGKKHGKKIMLHSCGSIYRIIPDLIDAGVDILHPLQAAAYNMDAKSLSQYKNDLTFVGGIDAQLFLLNSTPQQIKDEVYRVKEILGPRLIVSPSHEAVLPNVPPENLLAMAQAAAE